MPRTINQLPVLARLTAGLSGTIDFERTGFLIVQHALETTVCELESLHQLGAKYENMFYCGKIYSSSTNGIEALQGKALHYFEHDRENVLTDPFGGFFNRAVEGMIDNFVRYFHDRSTDIDTVIILDDGGTSVLLLEQHLDGKYSALKKYRLGAVEQTTAGLRGIIQRLVESDLPQLHIPVIATSASAAKKTLEPAFIATAVFKSILEACPEIITENNLNLGVIGFGAIGESVAVEILKRNSSHQIYIFDASEMTRQAIEERNCPSYHCCSTLQELFGSATDIIFGASGNDVMSTHLQEVIETVSGIAANVKLMSCSSENKEFYSLVRYAYDNHVVEEGGVNADDNPLLKNLLIRLGLYRVVLLRGGYPINFSPPHYSVPAKDIQVIVGILLGSVVQAFLAAQRPNESNVGQCNLLRVHPSIQNAAVAFWLEDGQVGRYPASLLERFSRRNAVDHLSGYTFQRDGQTDVLYGIRASQQTEVDEGAGVGGGFQSEERFASLDALWQPIDFLTFASERALLKERTVAKAFSNENVRPIFVAGGNLPESMQLKDMQFNLTNKRDGRERTIEMLLSDPTIRYLHIEGKAGIGKTRLCERIYYDWAMNELWNNRFDFVFFINMKRALQLFNEDPTNFSLTTLILNLYELEGLDTVILARLLEQQPEKMLFIFEGCDEVIHATDLMEVFSDEILSPPYSVIFSSRTDSLPEIYAQRNPVTVVVQGLTTDNIAAYMQRTFQSMEQPNLSGSNIENSKLLSIPLYLEITCLIWVEIQTRVCNTRDLNVTEIWILGELIDASLRRARQAIPLAERRRPQPQRDFNLICERSFAALTHPSPRTLQIDPITEGQCLNMGLIVRLTSVGAADGSVVCEFAHDLLREFCIAQYLFSHLSDIGSNRIEGLLNTVLLSLHMPIADYLIQLIRERNGEGANLNRLKQLQESAERDSLLYHNTSVLLRNYGAVLGEVVIRSGMAQRMVASEIKGVLSTPHLSESEKSGMDFDESRLCYRDCNLLRQLTSKIMLPAAEQRKYITRLKEGLSARERSYQAFLRDWDRQMDRHMQNKFSLQSHPGSVVANETRLISRKHDAEASCGRPLLRERVHQEIKKTSLDVKRKMRGDIPFIVEHILPLVDQEKLTQIITSYIQTKAAHYASAPEDSLKRRLSCDRYIYAKLENLRDRLFPNATNSGNPLDFMAVDVWTFIRDARVPALAATSEQRSCVLL